MERSNFVIKIMSFVAFIAIICYIGYYIIDSQTDPLKTVVATSYTLEESTSTRGYAVRTETVLYGNSSTVALMVDDGDKVSNGEVIATEYQSTEAIERVAEIRDTELKIDQLENMLHNFSLTAGNEQALNSVLNLSYAVKSGDLSNLDMLSLELETHVFESDMYSSSKELENEIASLEEKRTGLQAASSSDTNFLYAEAAGIFTSSVDGYEHVSPADLEADLTPSSLEMLFASRDTVNDDVLGKIISEIIWYYATTVDAEVAKGLQEGQAVTLRFTKTYSQTLSMNVESIGKEEAGKCAVVFSSNKYLSDICGIRGLTADIVFATYSGIRVPKEAIHLDEEGNTFVYLLSGLQAEKVAVEILGDSEDFYIVKKDPSGAIRDGSEIIVSANDLYDGKVLR